MGFLEHDGHKFIMRCSNDFYHDDLKLLLAAAKTINKEYSNCDKYILICINTSPIIGIKV